MVVSLSIYVGYTTRLFMFRVAEHLFNDQSPIVQHYKETKYNIKKSDSKS